MTAPAKAAPMHEDVTREQKIALVEHTLALVDKHREAPFHSVEWLGDNLAALFARTARPDAGDDYVLPCDVHLPIAAVVKAGCTLATLKLAMEFEDRPRHFDGNPRDTLRPDAGDEDVERVAITDNMVREAMQTAWDDFCSDAQAIPGDIRRVRGKTFFEAGTWADHTAMHLRAALAAMREGVDRGMVDREAAKAIRSAFFTSVSGEKPHRYHLSLAYPTMKAMHEAEVAIKAWAKSVLEPES